MPSTQQQHPLRIGGVEMPSRFFLSPLASYTSLAFRLCARELGGLGLATTDLVNARSLLEKRPRAFELIETCPEDRPLAVQIYGPNKEELCAAAQMLEARGVSIIDLNMGCPARKVVRGGGGSAMMRDACGTVALVRALVESVKVPVTVKMRLGWDDANITAPFFAREFEQAGVAAITIHGRTREQGFGGSVNRAGIRAVVEAVQRIPVIGNGDIRTVEDARTMFAETGCAAVGIGRGGLLNPWIFRQCEAELVAQASSLRTDHHRKLEACATITPPAYEDRVDFMARHFEKLMALRTEKVACVLFRKIAKWYGIALRVPRPMRHRLVMIKDAAEFRALMAELRAIKPSAATPGREPHIPVPSGPNARW